MGADNQAEKVISRMERLRAAEEALFRERMKFYVALIVIILLLFMWWLW